MRGNFSKSGMTALCLIPVALLGNPRMENAQSDSLKRHASPGLAIWASLIPGGGQVINRRWLKAGFFIALESYLASRFVQNQQRYADAVDSDSPMKTTYLTMRNRYAWWTLLAHIWSMLDAYVDAHLVSFPEGEPVEYPADTLNTTMGEI